MKIEIPSGMNGIKNIGMGDVLNTPGMPSRILTQKKQKL